MVEHGVVAARVEALRFKPRELPRALRILAAMQESGALTVEHLWLGVPAVDSDVLFFTVADNEVPSGPWPAPSGDAVAFPVLV